MVSADVEGDHPGVDPQEKFDELRKLANTEYFDIMLLHGQRTATWPADTTRWQDGILEPESKKTVVSHGAVSYTHLDVYKRQTWIDSAVIPRVEQTAASPE